MSTTIELEKSDKQEEIFDERLTMIIRAYRDEWIYVVEGTYWDTIYARKKRVKEEEQELDKMANRWMDMNPCKRCNEHIDFGNRSNFCECCLLTVDIDLLEFTGFSIYFKNN